VVPPRLGVHDVAFPGLLLAMTVEGSRDETCRARGCEHETESVAPEPIGFTASVLYASADHLQFEASQYGDVSTASLRADREPARSYDRERARFVTFA
jgi:hypothetical protein